MIALRVRIGHLPAGAANHEILPGNTATMCCSKKGNSYHYNVDAPNYKLVYHSLQIPLIMCILYIYISIIHQNISKYWLYTNYNITNQLCWQAGASSNLAFLHMARSAFSTHSGTALHGVAPDHQLLICGRETAKQQETTSVHRAVPTKPWSWDDLSNVGKQ